MESVKSNSELASLVFESMNKRNFSPLAPHLSEEAAIDFPGAGLIVGKKRGLIFLNVLLRKYPVLKFTIKEIITSDERACVVWTNKGKDASGNSYSNSGMTLIHFTNCRISFISDYFKDTSFTE